MFDWWEEKEQMTPIEEYFDSISFYDKFSIIQSAKSGELREEHPKVPFSESEIIKYAAGDDWSPASYLGESLGSAEKSIDDTATDIKDTVTGGFNFVGNVIKIVVGIGGLFILSMIYKNFKGK